MRGFQFSDGLAKGRLWPVAGQSTKRFFPPPPPSWHYVITSVGLRSPRRFAMPSTNASSTDSYCNHSASVSNGGGGYQRTETRIVPASGGPAVMVNRLP